MSTRRRKRWERRRSDNLRAPSSKKLDLPRLEFVDAADDADFLVADERIQNRRGCLQLFDVELDVAMDRIREQVAALALHRLDRGSDGGDQRRQVARQRGAVLGRFEGGCER